MVVAIEEAKDLDALMVDQLLGSLHVHEQWMNKENEECLEQALQIELSTKEGMEGLKIDKYSSDHYQGRGRGRGRGYGRSWRWMRRSRKR